MKQYARRGFFIRNSVQGRLVAGCILFMTGGAVLFSVLLTLFSPQILTAAPAGKADLLLLLKEFLSANWLLLVASALLLIVISLVLSHRIAGPLYRFERTLEHMLQGELSHTIVLRKNDEGQELATKINQFNFEMSQTLRGVKISSAAIENLLDQIGDLDLPPEHKEELASICWSAREQNRRVSGFCDTYTLQDGNKN